jgi:HEAT repeat protein
MAVVSAVVFGVLLCRQSEPSYGGRSLTVWLERYSELSRYCDRLSYEDQTNGTAQRILVSSEEYRALQQIGSDAVPTLLRLVGTPDHSAISDKLASFAAEHGLSRCLPQRREPKRMRDLGEWGFDALSSDDAQEAVPGLIAILRCPPSSANAASAARCLGAIGPSASSAVPALLVSFESTNLGVRIKCAEALGEIGAKPSLIVPELRKLLEDSGPAETYDVVMVAADSLAAFGKDAAPAVPDLIRLYSSYFDPREDAGDMGSIARQSSMRGAAEDALTRITGKPLFRVFMSALSETNDHEVRLSALHALGDPDSNPKVIVPALVGLLHDKDAEVRCHALNAIEVFGPKARTASAAVTRLLRDQDPQVRNAATNAIKSLNSPQS